MPSQPADGWPGVTILVPAYNEEQVIADCVRAALAVDYPELEVLVLDDGSQTRPPPRPRRRPQAMRALRGRARPRQPREGRAAELGLRAPLATSWWS